MNKFFWFIILYFGFVFLSVMFATIEMPAKLKLDSKRKRVLWLLSSLALIPFIIFMVQTPFFIFTQIKKFIEGKES